MVLVTIPEELRGLEAQAAGPSSPAFRSSTASRCSSCRCSTRNSSSRCYIMDLLLAPHTTVHPQPRIQALHGSHLKAVWDPRRFFLRLVLLPCQCEDHRPSCRTPSLRRLLSRTPPNLNRHLHLQNPLQSKHQTLPKIMHLNRVKTTLHLHHPEMINPCLCRINNSSGINNTLKICKR